MDFEVATRNGLNLVFPGVTVKACFFHFTRCTCRKTQECGLVVRYRENDNIRKLVRRAARLRVYDITSKDETLKISKTMKHGKKNIEQTKNRKINDKRSK